MKIEDLPHLDGQYIIDENSKRIMKPLFRTEKVRKGSLINNEFS